jgi:hypothetical protein
MFFVFTILALIPWRKTISLREPIIMPVVPQDQGKAGFFRLWTADCTGMTTEKRVVWRGKRRSY